MAAEIRSSSSGREGWRRREAALTGDRSDNGDFFGDLFTLKVLLREGQFIRDPVAAVDGEKKPGGKQLRWRLLHQTLFA